MATESTPPKTVLYTGASGMLAYDAIPTLESMGYTVVGVSSKELNLLHGVNDILETVKKAAPDMIIHAAAMTNVDACEENPELAMAINKDGTRKLAVCAQELNLPLAYISTDYVFDGNQDRPYLPDDKPNPLSQYGWSKYYGELIVKELVANYAIIRTSWLYGRGRNNFVQKVVESAQNGQSVPAFTDSVGSPTSTLSLARLIGRIIQQPAMSGTYHGVDAGMVSRYHQAVTVCKKLGLSPDHVTPSSMASLNLPAPRPHFSAMGSGSLEVIPWESALEEYLNLLLHEAPTAT